MGAKGGPSAGCGFEVLRGFGWVWCGFRFLQGFGFRVGGVEGLGSGLGFCCGG